MSIPSREERDLSEGVLELLGNIAKALFWAGVLACVVGIGFLVYTGVAAGGGADPTQAAKNVDLFGKVLLFGAVAVSVGSAFLFWGEDVMAGLLVVVGAALVFSPLYLPSVGIDMTKPVAGQALEALRNGGLIIGIIGILVLMVDLAGKAKLRVQQGSKADQLKYGKGIREERDRQNVFMGKCWQLPYCRKFVREKCPIYHAKTSCWKELVGCMCEEQVIRNAMENKPIPKDALLASKMIPHNHKLTINQKRERCKTCVIYNEHQKHKYKLALPLVLTFFSLFYVLLRQPLLAGTGSLVNGIDRIIGSATFKPANGSGGAGGLTTTTGGAWFNEILAICIMLVAFTYAMKLLEYLIFKLKV